MEVATHNSVLLPLRRKKENKCKSLVISLVSLMERKASTFTPLVISRVGAAQLVVTITLSVNSMARLMQKNDMWVTWEISLLSTRKFQF